MSWYGDAWADVYDDEHAHLIPSEDQLSFLEGLAAGGRVLELGIGTGRVALPLAARGVDVSGVELSPSMVQRLKAKPGGSDIPIEIGDMAIDVPPGPYSLVYVVFNTFYVLPSQERQLLCMTTVAKALAARGVFVLECYNPAVRFAPGNTFRTWGVHDNGFFAEASEHDAIAQTVIGTQVQLGGGNRPPLHLRLRYVWPSELDLMARLAGLSLQSRHADWRGSAFTSTSTHHVSVYAHADELHEH